MNGAVVGDSSFGLAYGDFDDFLAAVLGGSWSGTAVAASNTLTIDTLPTANDTVTIGGIFTYTFKASPTDPMEVAIGSSLAEAQANLVAKINLINELVTISAFSRNVATVTAKVAGDIGNSITTTETFVAGTNVFSAGTLSGGSDPVTGTDSVKQGTTIPTFHIA